MRIFSWNVNGIRAIAKKDFHEWMASVSPDILCLQETKVQEDQLDGNLVDIEGYHSYFSHAEKKGYSGVAVYSKEKPLRVVTKTGDESIDREGRILMLQYENFILFNIYFPNGQQSGERLDYKLRFYDRMLDWFEELKNEGNNLIVCGDYNTAHRPIDIKNPKSNEKRSGFLPVERAWIDKFIDHGYLDIYRKRNPETVKYSWWSYRFNAREKNVGWRIDYFFINEAFEPWVGEAEIHDEVFGSDHCPISIEIQKPEH